MLDLTPELLERAKRIAEAEKKTLKRVLCEAVSGVLDPVRHAEPAESRRMVMSTVKITQADWDRVWLELAELRQSLNARPIAPTPDYRSDLPADDQCGCEESERLKAELGASHLRIAELEAHLLASDNRRGRLETQLAAANALLERALFNSHHLGDGLSRAVRAHLSSHPAAPKRNDSEQRLLDAMSDVGYTDLELLRDRPGESDGLKRAAAAELARRGHG